jgi:hypothetical protein
MEIGTQLKSQGCRIRGAARSVSSSRAWHCRRDARRTRPYPSDGQALTYMAMVGLRLYPLHRPPCWCQCKARPKWRAGTKFGSSLESGRETFDHTSSLARVILPGGYLHAFRVLVGDPDGTEGYCSGVCVCVGGWVGGWGALMPLISK